MERNYIKRLEDIIKSEWGSAALCDYRGKSNTFGDLATRIEKCHILFEACGIKEGEHIALCAKNTAHWAMSFLSINTYTVVVPILCDFHPDSVNMLVHHSDSVLLFTDPDIYETLDAKKMPGIKGVISVADFSLLYCRDEKLQAAYDALESTFATKHPDGFSAADVCYPDFSAETLAVINYTSGTTSAPKGVMLTYGNISASVDFAVHRIPADSSCNIVSMLPMAHIYGLVFEFLYPLVSGVTVYYLGKTPAPSLLLKAMGDIKPYLILTVPLVMEKVYKSSLKPTLSKWYMKVLMAVPGLNKVLGKVVRTKLQTAFGGNFIEVIMGGAPLNPEVEKCFRKIGFNYTVGYGMTEAAPLLAYEDWWDYAATSCGKSVPCATVRIDSEDPEHVAGEIQAKGDNICLGYYKNEEATAAAFTADGFLRTGDLGVIDKDGNIYIKGRSKSMILSANGQNIYPEEVEAVVNAQDWVVESVVVDRGAKLVALVNLDKDGMKKTGLDDETMAAVPEAIRVSVNKSMPSYSKLTKVEVVDVPFEKTPKMSIKRFMYK